MTSKTREELARDFYYLSQFGFTKAPVMLGDGGDEKLRRFATALCNMSGADGEVTEEERDFIVGYCSAKGYPQSVIDDIPAMCKAAEAKSIDALVAETKNLLTMGSLAKTARQIVYDAIRAAGSDGLADEEKTVIEKMAESMGLSTDDLANIHELVKKENALREERIALLFPDGHPCLPKK